MTRSSPILYWVLGLLVLCAVLGFYNGFRTATHRDTPSWAGGSTLSTSPGQAAPPGIDPPEAQPLAPDNTSGVTPVQTAPAEKAKPKNDDDDQSPDSTTATPVGEPKPVALPPATGDKPAADKPTAEKPAGEKPKAPTAATPAKPRPAATPAAPPPAEAPPPAQQPTVPY